MHFKLATRKSSSSLKDMPNNTQSSDPSANNSQSINPQTSNDADKDFDKALRETSKEPDLNKRLKDIKTAYESNKLDDLLAKLKDAESKNEYLTSIITHLQSKRTVNSAYQ